MARKNKALPDPLKTWIDFVNLRIEVFCKALEYLVITDNMKRNEGRISAALYPKLIFVCYELKVDSGIPEWDKKRGAATDKELNLESINKRPDFTCTLFDNLAETIDKYKVDLHIECKCIGFNRNPKSRWNLNQNYINDGINRFDALSHEYGKGARDGIMIGYIISSTKPDIQKQINDNLPTKIEKLNFVTKNKVEKVSTRFVREVVEPTNFTMHHIWADYA